MSVKRKELSFSQLLQKQIDKQRKKKEENRAAMRALFGPQMKEREDAKVAAAVRADADSASSEELEAAERVLECVKGCWKGGLR